MQFAFRHPRAVCCCFLMSLPIGFAAAQDLWLARGGKVFVDEECWQMMPTAWGNGGKVWGAVVGESDPDARAMVADFKYLLQKKAVLSRGSVRLEQIAVRKVRVTFSHICSGDIHDGGLGAVLTFPSASSNVTWAVDGGGACELSRSSMLRSSFSSPFSARKIVFKTSQGRMTIEFAEPAVLQARGPRVEVPGYSFRMGRVARDSVDKGDRREFSLLLSFDDVKELTPRVRRPYVVQAGTEWVPLDYRKDIVAGSAVDFSEVSGLDAPAGKYGWLRSVGGHFEYEGRPGRKVRYWGANLTGGACFPTNRIAAERLADRLARIGYNAVRIHHHDWGCSQGYDRIGELNADYLSRLDLLLAACIERGLYVTTDLYVSRNVTWRSIGEDRPGTVSHAHFKGLVLVHEGAFSNYCGFAEKFLNHVNPLTGRAYKDEPALNLLSLVNEGLFFSAWRSLVSNADFRQAWRTWLTLERAKDPSCYPGYDPERPPEGLYVQKDVSSPRSDVLTAFSVHMELRFYVRMKRFLHDMGCRALLTDVNFGPSRSGMREMRRSFDYVDSHFYYEHPERLGSAVRRANNVHPLFSRPPMAFGAKRFPDRPFVASEFNWCAPCEYRAVGALLGAGVAAHQDWSGVWRFAYSQGGRNLADNVGVPDSFDVAGDPIMLGMERAAASLYLRGDMPSSRYDGLLRLEQLRSSEFKADLKSGSVIVSTPRTAGGYALPGGKLDAGVLRLRIRDSAAAVWMTSLDSASLADSRRIVLFHLTDALGNGAVFEDETRRKFVRRGEGVMLRRGRADVRFQANSPSGFVLYALDAVGNRLGRMPLTVSDRGVSFSVDIRSPFGAVFQYELVKEGK